MGDRSLKAGELPRRGGSPIETAGSAAFRRERMVGLLNIEETDTVLALRGEMGKVYATLPDPLSPDQVLNIRYHQENKPQYRAALVGGKPVVFVRLQFEGEILAAAGRTDYSKPENRPYLERHLERLWRQRTYAPLMAKVQPVGRRPGRFRQSLPQAVPDPGRFSGLALGEPHQRGPGLV